MTTAQKWASELRRTAWLFLPALLAVGVIWWWDALRLSTGLSTRSLVLIGLPVFGAVVIAVLGLKGIRQHLLASEPDKPLITLAALFAGGAVLAFLYGVTGKSGTVSHGILLVTAMAAAISVGTLLGFLFGIPRFDYSNRSAGGTTPPQSQASTPTATATQNATGASRYRPSTNLDDVADWLTKLIVGIGLSQIVNVGPAVTSIAEAILTSCGAECARQRGFVSAIIVSGAIGGFLFGYIWTRLHYGKLAARSDAETMREIDAASAAAIGVGKEPEKQLIRAGKATQTDFRETTPADEDAKREFPADESSERETDPNKGRFGGSPVLNGRALRATIEPSDLGAGLYRVTLTVTSMVPAKPLQGEVVFVLHPTFREHIVRRLVENGIAQLAVISYGAFTVGAIADGGETKLELDLANHPEAPEDFRSR